MRYPKKLWRMWNYDFETIKYMMEKIGFSDVTKKKAFESSISEMRKLETDDEGRLLETACREAINA